MGAGSHLYEKKNSHLAVSMLSGKSPCRMRYAFQSKCFYYKMRSKNIILYECGTGAIAVGKTTGRAGYKAGYKVKGSLVPRIRGSNVPLTGLRTKTLEHVPKRRKRFWECRPARERKVFCPTFFSKK